MKSSRTSFYHSKLFLRFICFDAFSLFIFTTYEKTTIYPFSYQQTFNHYFQSFAFTTNVLVNIPIYACCTYTMQKFPGFYLEGKQLDCRNGTFSVSYVLPNQFSKCLYHFAITPAVEFPKLHILVNILYLPNFLLTNLGYGIVSHCVLSLISQVLNAVGHLFTHILTTFLSSLQYTS